MSCFFPRPARSIAVLLQGILAGSIALLIATTVHAQTWDGGGADDNWTTIFNWNPNAMPANNGTANVAFGGTTRTTPDLNQNFDVNSLTFNNTSGAFMLGSTLGRRLTIRGGGITQNDATRQTIDHDIALGATQTWNTALGALVVNGDISGGFAIALNKSGGNTLTLTGNNTYSGATVINGGRLSVGGGGTTGNIGSSVTNDGDLTFNRSDDVTYSGVISGSGTVTKGGTGTLELTGLSSYTGGVNVTRGTLTIGYDQIAPAGQNSPLGANGDITLGSATAAGTLEVDFADGGGGNAVTLDRPIHLMGIGGVIARPCCFFDDLVLTGEISGTGGVTLNSTLNSGFGFGEVILNHANNPYTGPTLIDGDVYAEAPNTLGVGSAVTLDTDAIAFINSDQSLGSLSGGGSSFIDGFLLLDDSVTLTVGSDDSDTTFTGGLLEQSGSTTAGKLIKVGTGVWTVTSQFSDFLHPVRIENGAISVSFLGFIDRGPLGAGSEVTLGSAGAVGTLRYTGASVSTNKELTLEGAGGAIEITNAAATVTLTGPVAGPAALVKRGPGTLALTGAALATSVGFTVEEGRLSLTSGLTSPGGVVQIAAGGELLTGGFFNRSVAGQGAITTSGNLLIGDFTDPSGFEFEGGLQVGSHAVVLLDADGAQLGSATLAGGSLGSNASITLANSLTGNGTVTGIFDNQGTVTGAAPGLVMSGFITGPGAFLGDVTFAGVYSPGNSPAIVPLGSPTFADRLILELGGTTPGAQHDQLTIAADATFGGQLDIDLINGFSPSLNDEFVLATYGSHTGEFSSLDVPPLSAGLKWALDYGPTQLILSTTSSRLPGDIDEDGDVDRADAALFASHLGTTSGAIWTTGDFDGDAATTLHDLALLQTHLGMTTPSPTAAAVPEPGTLGLAVLVLVAMTVYRARVQVR